MRSAGIGYVLVSLLSACSSRALLAVDLRTDLVPEIEIYGLVSPRLQLIEDTDFDLGAGLGLRFKL